MPNTSHIAECFRFGKREHAEGETVLDYVAAMRKLSDQKRLLSEADLTFTTVLDIAVAKETPARDASELQSKRGPGASQSVHKLYVKNKSD